MEQAFFHEVDRAGWIFTKRIDISMVWGVFILVCCLAVLSYNQDFLFVESMESFLALKICIDMAHVFASISPTLRRFKEQAINLHTIIFAIAWPCVASFVVNFYSPRLFHSILAFLAIGHILLQQYGLAMVCRAKADEGLAPRWLDDLECFNILVVPVVFWLSPLSSLEKSYFFSGDFAFSFYAEIAKTALIIHWSFHCLYFYLLVFKYKSVNWAKLSMMVGTWTWLYVSLVVLQDYFIFWSCLFLIHGLVYMMFCFQDYKRSTVFIKYPQAKINLILGNPIVFFLIINFFALIWFLFYKVGKVSSLQSDASPFLVMIWWPLLIHYSVDSIIWKRKNTLHVHN